MEEVVDCITNQSSPQVLAIHFLLRYAGCRRALMSSGDEVALSSRVAPVPAPGSKCPDIAGALTSVAVTPTAVRARVSEESYATRFSRAYAAARHLSTLDHVPQAASRKCT